MIYDISQSKDVENLDAWSMTKKGHLKFWAWKWKNFL